MTPTTSPTPPALAAVVTTYRPDDGLYGRFQAIQVVCPRIILVDNTPGGHRFAPLPPGFELVQDGRNKGLGPALNLGVARAQAQGAQAVLLYDQDSTPSEAGVRTTLDALLAARQRCGDRVAVGPHFVDDARPPAPRPAAADGAPALATVSCIPTSGMAVWLTGWSDTGGFSDQLFLDFVDFEWCWRAAARGWSFFRADDVQMLHRLGLAQRRALGLTFHVPAPYRHYFQFRDTLRLLPRSYVPLYSKLRLGMLLPMKLLVYPFILDRGAERVRWMVLGLRDALRGVGGIGAAKPRLDP